MDASYKGIGATMKQPATDDISHSYFIFGCLFFKKNLRKGETWSAKLLKMRLNIDNIILLVAFLLFALIISP